MREFATFYEEMHPRLISSLAAWCGDIELATDAADEAAIRTLERWDKVKVMANPEGWVFRVAMNQVRRKAKRRTLERNLLRRERPAQSVPGPAGEMWALVADLCPRADAFDQVVIVDGVAQIDTE